MLNIVCALQCEAKPLIQHYGLRGISDSVFSHYEKHSVRLLVTGIGKTNTAAALGYLYARYGEQKNEAWLNVGIAGHPHAEPGALYVVNKSVDSAQGVRYYPVLHGRHCQTAVVTTVEKPEQNYPENTLYDMEASAFFAIANRFSSAELIGSAKIVSDNKALGADHVDERYVEKIIAARVPDISHLVEEYLDVHRQFSALYQASPLYAALLTKYRFSVYEQKQLGKLSRKWNLYYPEQALMEEEGREYTSAKSLLKFMQNRLSHASFEF